MIYCSLKLRRDVWSVLYSTKWRCGSGESGAAKSVGFSALHCATLPRSLQSNTSRQSIFYPQLTVMMNSYEVCFFFFFVSTIMFTPVNVRVAHRCSKTREVGDP